MTFTGNPYRFGSYFFLSETLTIISFQIVLISGEPVPEESKDIRLKENYDKGPPNGTHFTYNDY